MRLRTQVLIAAMLRIGAVMMAAGLAASCTDLFGNGDGMKDKPANTETATVWELTLMAGRYTVMLDQARTILKLPEPAAIETQYPAGVGEGLAERKALAAQQVVVAHEFYADAAKACAKRRLPGKLKTMACAHRAGIPAELRQPAALDVAALTARNEALDKFVMPWWDAACATAPKHGKDDEPACPME